MRNNRRPSGVKAAILATLLAAIAVVMAEPASADPSPRTTGHIATRTLSEPKEQSPAGTNTAICFPGATFLERTSSCSSGYIRLRFKDKESGATIGTGNLNYSSSVTLDPRNRYKWTDEVTLRLTELTIPEETLVLGDVGVNCGACLPSPGNIQRLVPNTKRTYSMVISSPGTAIVTDLQAPFVTITGPALDTTSIQIGKAFKVRCDNTERMSPAATGGCVYPDAVPTYVLSTAGPYNEVASHVAWAQANLQNHWGKKGSGPALQRTSKKDLIKANRDTACPKSMPRPPGQNCDEYPFASSLQGASNNPTDFSYRMISASQNCQEGSIRKSWYNANRLFEEEKFWVEVTSLPTNAAPPTVSPFDDDDDNDECPV
ncbi:hypothetical protein LKL35_11145 [Streptomyces sp. ET3-23]|uniref:NucA/NucB deoxyribonuclease domain-containing protein n=1 Tax=Streptomyces sp. ET3-23 TaxID=2885643 RepID=UPI001D12C325|nr:hypothetical protein [Streptomyces sp. ET3-23]MCC2275969.1 hypothetical protein [Streptomyces sp. ET3-23]